MDDYDGQNLIDGFGLEGTITSQRLRGFAEAVRMMKQQMKRIAHRIDKWDYSGGDVGNIWVDIKGKQYHHIVSIMEAYYKDTNNRNFIINYEKGEMFLDDTNAEAVRMMKE